MKFPLILALIALYSLPKTLGSVPSSFPDFVSILPNYTSPDFPPLYAGFAPLDNQNESALYYYYFPSIRQSTDTPTLLWLNGGPACSDTWSIFVESGPFRFQSNKDGGYSVYSIDEKDNLQSWTAFYNVLYFDQPVGTGYSYTNKKYRTNEDEIANDIWVALQYFLKVHPETINSKWYFAGESYAGKFVPAATYWTVCYNEQIRAKQRQGTIVNLQGMIVGSGFILPVSQRITSAEASQAANLLTPNQYKQIKTLSADCQQLFAMGSNFTIQADTRCDSILGYYDGVSGISIGAISLPDIAMSQLGAPQNPYFNHKDVIKALHAKGSKKKGPLYNDSSSIAVQNLQFDRLNSSLIYIDYLLTKIPCLFFAGNFDGQDGSYGTYEWFKYLSRPYTDILQTTKNIWYVNKTSIGSFTQFQNLTYIIINAAGHLVPYFQLNATVKMIEIFTLRKNNWSYYNGFTPTPVPQIMCQYSNNCNGNGQCTPQGTCACKVGYGLADCSAQAIAFETSRTYIINQRGYLFFKVPLNGKDILLQFENEGGALGIYYTPFTTGPIADHEEAEASLLPTPNAPTTRTLYLNAYERNIGYLTVQNIQYFDSAKLSIKQLPLKQEKPKIMMESYPLIDILSNQKDISLLLYVLGLLMILSVILIIVNLKERKKKLVSMKSEEKKNQLAQLLYIQAKTDFL